MELIDLERAPNCKSKQLTIRLDATVHKRLKMHSVLKEKSIQKLVEEFILNELAKSPETEEASANSG